MKDNLEMIRERLKNTRKMHGISLQKLSEETGISKSTLQRYETGGIRNLPLDKLTPLAKALHTTPAYLMGWENDAGETDVVLTTLGIANESNVRWENVEAMIDGKPTPDKLDAKTESQISAWLRSTHLLGELSESSLTQTEIELLKCFRQLTEKQQKAVIELLQLRE